MNGVKVIPNVRYGDHRTYKCCCDGLPKNAVISVGSHGTLKHLADREIFAKGLGVVVKRLQPIAIIVYGTVPKSIFQKYRDMGIAIYHFSSDYGKAMNSLKGVI